MSSCVPSLHPGRPVGSGRRNRSWRSLLAILLVVSAIWLPGSRLAAQTCALPSSPGFAGHAFPLDTDPVPQAMQFVRAFPALAFTELVGLYAAPDGTDRLFVVERRGRIFVFDNRDNVATASLFLDLRTSVASNGPEQGLLGLAFDPAYASNRRFFVNYTALTGCTSSGAAGCTKVVRFEANPANANQALANSAVPILDFAQPFENHNGGALAFGPDGMLYVATGDGGDGGDPFRNGQNLAVRLGKILRVDVRAGAPSIVPATNPFVGVPNADPLVYHYGLRNPWRITFDRLTGDLLIGDVGQDLREEIDRVRAGTPGGLNFGWDYCEGTLDYRTGAHCSDIQSVPPVIEYAHFDNAGGNVVVGGYVYRGDSFPELYGAYLFADPASGNFWAWDGQDPVDPAHPGNRGVRIGTAPNGISSFGEDRLGEIYAVSSADGFIYRLARSGSGGSGVPFPSLLSATGLFSNVPFMMAAPGMVEYDVTAPLWSDGALKRRWMALPVEGHVTFHAREAWDFPVGTVFVKHFDLPRTGGGARRVETRVFLRQIDRWTGVTYRWNAAGTDATLLTAGLDETIVLGGGVTQSWHYPSTSECLSCHTAAAGRVLGVRTRQLFGTRSYANGVQAQLDAWSCAGLFDFDIRDKNRFEAAKNLSDTTATRTRRARSYAAANCEMCHQPGGPAPGGLDMRFTSAVSKWNMVNVAPTEGNLGLPSAKRILPGDPAQSIFWVRQNSTSATLRMARGTKLPDATAVSLLGSWVQSDVAVVDSDEDGFVDAVDVCPAVPDPLQRDADGDQIGDACDPDALPDLSVLSLSAPAGTILPGQPISLTATVKNGGAGSAAPFPVTFHLSANATFEPAFDVLLGSCWVESLVGGGATTTCSPSSARIPPSFRTGQPLSTPYRVISCANRAEVEREVSPANACTVAPQSVTVPEPTGALPIGLFGTLLLARLFTRRSRPDCSAAA